MNLQRRHLLFVFIIAAVFSVACGPSVEYEIVYAVHPPTWFEDGWSYYEVSQDEKSALFGARFGFKLIDLEQRREDAARYQMDFDQVASATFYSEGLLARLGSRDDEQGWFVEDGAELTLAAVPRDAFPKWSPDGSTVAYVRTVQDTIYVTTSEGLDRFGVDGSVTGLAWSPQGDFVYAVVGHEDGLSSIVRVAVASNEVETIRQHLDATNRFNSIGVSSDGRLLYVALASDGVPDPEARHQPNADRDMDIYELDIASGRIRSVVEAPGDDFYPQVIGRHLYWTHNEMQDAIVVVPTVGGEARVLVADAQIPYWRHDGRQIGFTYGGWRIADWALNLDAAMVDVDAEMMVLGEPTPIVVGYHEDFTPSWSPDGRWIAYHSHRSERPVTAYASEGTTDDIYLRRPAAPREEEIRLTDFGWEVGMADWSPDGKRLVFDSWDRNTAVSKPWIATIDPASGQLVSVERLPLPEGFHSALLAAWSPLGGEIAVVERIQGERQALWVLSVDGSMAEKLLEFHASTYGGVDWTPDGQNVVYAALSRKGMQLFSISRAGGQPEQLTQDGANLIHPQVSPDGRWIAATRVYRSKELRRMPLR